MSDSDDQELRPLNAADGDDGQPPASVLARRRQSSVPSPTEQAAEYEDEDFDDTGKLRAKESPVARDVMAAPITLQERLQGLPLYLVAIAFSLCAILTLAGCGIHIFTLYQAAFDLRIVRSAGWLQEAHDHAVVVSYAAGVLLGAPPAGADVFAMVDEPQRFSALRDDVSTSNDDVEMPQFFADGTAVDTDSTQLQRRFRQLRLATGSFTEALTEAADELPMGVSDQTISDLKASGATTVQAAEALIRRFHDPGTGNAVTATEIDATLEAVEGVARSTMRALAADFFETEREFIVRLPLMQCLRERIGSVVFAADGLAPALSVVDERNVAVDPPATATFGVGSDAVNSYTEVVGGALAEASPLLAASTFCGDSDAGDSADAVRAAERSNAAFVTALGTAAGANAAAADAVSDMGPAELQPISAYTAETVDDTFLAQIRAVIELRRVQTEGAIGDMAARQLRAGIALAFFVVATLTTIAGSALSWRFAAASVNSKLRYQRLVDRHAAVEDTSPLRGIRSEVLTMTVPGWDEYVQQQGPLAKKLRRKSQMLQDGEGMMGASTSGRRGGNSHRSAAYRKQSLVHGEAEALARSVRPRVMERLESARSLRGGSDKTSPSTSVNLDASMSSGGGRRKSTAGTDAAALDAATPEDTDEAPPGARAGKHMRDALTEFTSKLSCAIAQFRVFVPQPCFGDIEAEAANAALNGKGPGSSGNPGAGGGRSGGGSGGGGGASMPLQSTQMMNDLRTRELRSDKNQHLTLGTLMLIDCGRVLSASDSASFLDDVSSHPEAGPRVTAAIRPAFNAVSRFINVLEDVMNRHDGLLLGASGDEFGVVWNIVGQSPLHQARAVAAGLVLQRTLNDIADTERELASDAAARVRQLENAMASAGTASKRAKIEPQLTVAREEMESHNATAQWLLTRTAGIAVASSLMCAGTVTAQLFTGPLQGAGASTGPRGGSGGGARADNGGASTGVIDRSGRSLDRSGPTAMQKRARVARSSKQSGKASGPSVVAAAAPKWFEAVGPSLGLARHMLSLNVRLNTRFLVSEDVAAGATAAANAGTVLDDVTVRELRSIASTIPDAGVPTIITRPVALYFQQAIGSEQEQAAAATVTGGAGAAGGAARGGSNQAGAAGRGEGKRGDSARGLSTAGGARGPQGQWVTIHSIFLGFAVDERAPPLGWAEAFESLASNVRRSNPPAALDSLRDYLRKQAQQSGGGGGGGGGEGAAKAMSPSAIGGGTGKSRFASIARAAAGGSSNDRTKLADAIRSAMDNGTSKGRAPSDEDPVIMAWLADLEQRSRTAGGMNHSVNMSPTNNAVTISGL